MHGFMSSGATQSFKKNPIKVGQMSTGAVPEKAKKVVVEKKDDIEKPTKEIAEVGGDASMPTITSLEQLEAVHHFTLKSMALERNYEGEKFDKKSLLEFLTSLPEFQFSNS